MKHIALPQNTQRRLVWYLAMEEFVAANLTTLVPPSAIGEREAFFLWQVSPTVIFGRNQVMEAEVNLSYCKAHDIKFFRRKSGGGCVYADMGNVMLSYVCDNTDVAFTFSRFLNLVALALRRLGVSAEKSGRNDVMIGGRKVSGNAFTLLPKGSIVHGTMMYDVDFEALQKAITPSAGKISSKGVDSVRSHVTNLKEELEAAGHPVGLEAFKNHLIKFFCTDDNGKLDQVVLSDADMAEIDRLEQAYLDPAFLEGRHHSYSVSFGGRVEGVGEVKVNVGLGKEMPDQVGHDGSPVIESVGLEGDFFQTGEASKTLEAAIKGLPLEKDAIGNALKNKDLGILGLAGEDLLRIMFPSAEQNNKITK